MTDIVTGNQIDIAAFDSGMSTPKKLRGERVADWIEDRGRDVVTGLQAASQDQEGWHDDALRLAGGGLKNIAWLAERPGIKQGLQVLGAGGWAGGKLGEAAAQRLGIDPRLGKWTGGFAGDAVTGGLIKKGAQVAKTARQLDKLSPLQSGRLVTGGGFGAAPVGPRTKLGKLKAAATMRKSTRKAVDEAVSGIPPIEARIEELSLGQFSLKARENKRLNALFDSGELKATPKGLNSKQIQEFYGLTPKEMTKKHGFRYVNKGRSKEPNFQLKSTVSEAAQVELRNLRIKSVTDPALNARGLKKWKYINSRGMEAHHLTPIHVSSKLKQAYLYTAAGKPKKNGMAKWLKRIEDDAKKHMYHGNDPRNIVAARGSTRIPTYPAGQRSTIYHRAGTPGNPGYHNLEKQIEFPKRAQLYAKPQDFDTTPYRDLMRESQARLRALEEEILDVKVFDGDGWSIQQRVRKN